MERGLSGIRKYRARENVLRSLEETTSSISISINIIISTSINVGTVEPRLTTTSFIRPPRYYSHILSNQT